MAKSKILTVIVCVMAVANIVSAELIQGINIDFVPIGNPGNPGDTRAEANPSGCGAVGYEYQIGKYEVTNVQWDTFTAAAGAPTGNPSSAYDENATWTGTDIPTNGVSWYEVAQFCNYLTSGDKSLGAYLFSGNNANPGDFLGIDRDSAVSAYGIAYVIPTEDEWYKAAYYKPDGSGYSTYANGTDVAPIKGVDTNYDWAIGAPWNVGTGTMEQNGTFDMMGNIWECDETLRLGSYRGCQGGCYNDGSYWLGSSHRGNIYQDSEVIDLGFRVASVPEPCSLVLLSLGGLALMRKHRAK